VRPGAPPARFECALQLGSAAVTRRHGHIIAAVVGAKEVVKGPELVVSLLTADQGGGVESIGRRR
jgi:hypothetical protein